MMNSNNNEGFDFPIKRFEEMMNSNQVMYFDAAEFENIIQYYMDFGRMGLAKKAIKMGLQQHPNAFKLLLLKADLLSFEDKTEQAFQLLDDLVLIEPYNEDLYVMMANLHSKQDEHEKAIECLHKIIDLGGDSTLEDVHYLLGMEHLMLENYKKAKDHFIKTLEIDGDDEISLQNIVFCYEFLGKINDAKSFLNTYLDKNPYSAIAWHQLGNIHQDQEQLEESLKCYDYAIIADDYFVGAIVEKAKVLEKLQHYKEAIECFQQALTMEDPTSFVHYRIGNCYLKLNQRSKAISSFKKAVFEDPQLAAAWYALAKLYFISDTDKALRFLSKAKKIEPYNLTYTRKYAQLCMELNYLNEAQKAWKEVTEIKNTLTEEIISDADFLIAEGNLDTALNMLLNETDMLFENFDIQFRITILKYLMDLSTEEPIQELMELDQYSGIEIIYFIEDVLYNNFFVEEEKVDFLVEFFSDLDQ